MNWLDREVMHAGVEAPLRNHIACDFDWLLRPLCATGRHKLKEIRPGVHECQRAYCLRVWTEGE